MTNEYEKLKELHLIEQIRNQELIEDIKYLFDENENLRTLLKKPFEEIAKESVDFSNNYNKHLLRLGEWMVSQKAYKELAIELGEKLNISVEDIKVLAANKEINVLNNENVKSHHTNIKEQESISKLSYKLFKRIQKRN